MMEEKISYRFLQMKAAQAYEAGEAAEALRWTKLIDGIMAAMHQNAPDEKKVM